MNRSVANTRRAISLVELLVVMSGCTVILTTSAMLIHRAMRAQSQSWAFFDVERSALRLSGQFRQDVHRATAAEASNGSDNTGMFLRLELPGQQSVEYRHVEGTVVRTLSEGGRARSRDHFAFTPACDVEIQAEDAPRRLILTITSDPPDAPSGAGKQIAKYIETPVSVRAEASLGRDWRLTAPASDEEPPR